MRFAILTLYLATKKDTSCLMSSICVQKVPLLGFHFSSGICRSLHSANKRHSGKAELSPAVRFRFPESRFLRNPKKREIPSHCISNCDGESGTKIFAHACLPPACRQAGVPTLSFFLEIRRFRIPFIHFPSHGAWLSPARAPGSGPGGREFESRRPDTRKPLHKRSGFGVLS